MRRAGRSAFIAGGLLFLVVGVAPAQPGGGAGGNTGSSSGSSGGFTGSSGSSSSSGGFTGSSGSSSSSGGFTGSSGGSTGSGNMNRTGSGSGTNTVGSTGPLGRYYGTPLYNRLSQSQGSSGQFTITASNYPASYSGSFGTPLYDAASLARSATQGTTGLGTQGSATATSFAGASSAGIRRSAGYITEPVFDMPARPTMAAIQPDLQGIVSRASTTRLPSRDRIQVVADGDTIVLRGQVRDEKERRLAEAMIRLSPGVRIVRNELEPDKKSPAK